MNLISKLFYYLTKDRKQFRIAIFSKFVYTRWFKSLSDERYLSWAYRLFIGKKLDLKNPRGFNEKLQWLKLHDRQPKYKKMVDKFEVREFVKNTIGEEYLVPCLGLWKTFDEIDFSKLPDRFVLKCTHDSGSAIVCKDKNIFDFNAAKAKLTRCLNRDMFYWGREWAYKGLVPRIICEEYLDSQSGDIEDYKFMCFNGEPKMVFTCSERHSETGLKVTFFDMDWEKLPFCRHFPSSETYLPKPHSFDEMVKLSKKLSAGIPFARIDFYEVNEKPLFGEITLYPGCGFEEFNPEEWDVKLGDIIQLPSGV